jgi:adenylate cyclase
VVRLLNKYLAVMADIISRYQGTINEFIGDAILVLFGAPIQRPDDARRAVACALAMQLAMDAVNDDCEREGLPRIEMGASLTTGEVVVGNIGSHKRVKYGVVGSQVNLAARMESHTVGGQVLISESTRREAGEDLLLGAELVLRAKGFREPLKVYELQGLGGEPGLVMPDRTADAVPLATPVPVRFHVIHEKTVDEAELTGVFQRVWAGGAELRAEVVPAVLTNLKVQVLDAEGVAVPGDLYVKVTTRREAEHTGTVRFTAVPSEVATYLKHVVGSARG